MNGNKKISFEKTICIIMFVMGIIMSFLIPIWQTPDETAHLNQIGEAIGNDNFAQLIQQDINIDSIRIAFHSDQKMNAEDQQRILWQSPSYSRSEMLPHKISLSLIKHLPAYLGITLGILLGVPSYWALQLGELFSLLFYTLVCYQALKRMPVKKHIFGLLMLLPMALQEAGCIGYDTIVLSFSYLYIAEIFNLKYVKDTIELKDILKLLGIFLIIFYIKIPYAFFILLTLLLPLNKFNVQIGSFTIDENFIKKYRKPALVLMILLTIMGIYLMRDNQWIHLLLGLASEPLRTIYLILSTIRTFGVGHAAAIIGNFGWLDTPINAVIAFSIYWVLLFVTLIKSNANSVIENAKLKRWDYFIILGTFVILTLFVMFSMVNHTIMVILYGSENSPNTYDIHEALYVIPYIGGLQGRYFIPFLSLPFIAIPEVLKVDNKKSYAISLICMLALYVYVIVLLLERYWIV